MFKEIIENIALAERRAEEIERAAFEAAEKIKLEAHDKARVYLESADKEIKDAVKSLLEKAEKEAVLLVEKSFKEGETAQADILKAAEKNITKAADSIVQEFLKSI